LRSFPGVFFARKLDVAAQYGDYIQEYEVPWQRLLWVGSSKAKRLVFFHTGYKDDEALIETFAFPDEAWVEILRDQGYTGTRFGDDVLLFDLSRLKLRRTVTAV
jgi:hypothetical protein